MKAVNSLPATDSHSYSLSRAQAKALHLLTKDDATTDATITFDTGTSWDYTHSTAMSPTSYDFFGDAAHEISEAMGRVLFDGKSSEKLLELFKSGRPFTGTVSGGFSIDGTTNLLAFNTDPSGDFADWASSVPGDAYRASGEPGKVENVSNTDLRLLDVIGYDRKADDLVFAVDTTESMTPYIDNVKKNAINIINSAFGTASDVNYARIGIVGFKDAAGPDGPGETEQILKFTDQDTIDARKSAAVGAINAITVGGGGDIPEADNSGLLVALKGSLGDWRESAQSHKIILFSDAPVKDLNLAGQVEKLSHDLGVAVTNPTVTSTADGIVSGKFTFVPIDPSVTSAGGDAVEEGPATPPGPLPTGPITAQIYVIQVGDDPSATSSLSSIAANNGGTFFRGTENNLSDIIKGIITAAGLTVRDTTTGQTLPAAGQAYTGPVSGLTNEYVNITPDSLNITATTPNWFLHSGSGMDAINVSKAGGSNILDGSTGSNFLTGGTGNDTFYLDNRNPTAPIFSTVANFHSGDNVTVWGVNPTNFTMLELDNQGAAGFTGLDFIFTAPGHVDTSFVLAGYTSADLTNGKLTSSYGTTPDLPGLPGSQYLTVHAT